ncbi:hypothetical protein CEXT_723161 [Caerostris extrusa]|uniref:Uncharacterized protein n=1 Tax=Caerostris extrusa TaxID=172846 RepID=A0AAV4XCF7_CAEEX|nr:hypothetical protein CEXT_723161 [Caerostris extrusa]
MDRCRERDIRVILEMYLYDRVSPNEISMATVEGASIAILITRLPFIISDVTEQYKRHFQFTMGAIRFCSIVLDFELRLLLRFAEIYYF